MSSLSKALAALEAAARQVRDALAHEAPATPERGEEAHWLRQMLSVLEELSRRGGRVSKAEFLEIGEMYGYMRQGMAGFYQLLVRSENGDAVLTDEGRDRIRVLRSRYEPILPSGLTWSHAHDDPFVVHVRSSKIGSGAPYRAEDAKRDLYRQ